MTLDFVSAQDAHDLKSGYSQCVVVSGAQRTAYVSGQIPVRADGTVPHTFRAQAEQAWANVEAQLKAAGFGMQHLVRHTTYLSNRCYTAENSAVRREILGAHPAALTVIIAGIFDEAWLLEIEAVAAQ